MKDIRQNALVEVKPEYLAWVKEHPEFPKNIRELVAEERFFYLGEIPNLPGMILVSPIQTGKVISFHKEVFTEVQS